MKQMALLASAALTVMVWAFAIGLVAAPLHGDHAVVVEQLRPSPLLNSARSLHLSAGTIGMACFVLFVGIALTRMMRGWLEKRFLPSTSLDVGVRTSLVTGLSYVGIIIALLSASSTLGLQLEKITLIASALSVGIGFGLQSIIQNFVSGVILLIERPVKQGDWVSVSGAEDDPAYPCARHRTGHRRWRYGDCPQFVLHILQRVQSRRPAGPSAA
jgi:small-conductance mechanosensitive channel